MIKKLLVPLAVLTVLALSACGKSSDKATVSPSPAVSATPAVTTAASVSPTAATKASENPEEKTDNTAESDSEAASDTADAESTESEEIPEKRVSNNETAPDEISIINGTSIEIYGIYITSNPDGNPGENIISGSTLGEGEEITLAYANVESSDNFSIIIEDESGIQYHASGFELTNGSVVELRLDGSSLEAIVQ